MAKWCDEDPGKTAGVARDIYDSPAWTAYRSDPQCGTRKDSSVTAAFALSLAIDGISPYTRRSYSIWPVALTPMDLPPWIRNKVESVHIPLIIPGEVVLVRCST
jgi:hypothetical protein